MNEPQVKSIWELSDLQTPWCLYVAVTLQIADHIADGVDNIDELARLAGCDRDALHAMLGHLVSKGIFEQPVMGHFALNEIARQLLDPAVRLSLDLDGIGGRFAYTWGTLLTYVRTGKPAYREVFGVPFWEDLNAHPEIAADFDALIGPAGHGIPAPDFEISAGWEQIHTFVDVGGGTGAMLAEILRLKPHIHGILVDLPATVARSDEIFRAAGVQGRVKTFGQSFFDPLPAGADLYLLRGILNDWPDQETVEILKRCSQAAHPHGRVVVLKSIVPDGSRKDLTIEMVLLGGKRRTVTEFKQLASQAGLEVITAGQQSSYFVVECRPV